MKGKFMITNFMERNPSELTPWQSENNISNLNDNTHKIDTIDEHLSSTKRFLPRVLRFHERSSTKLSKIEYQLAKNYIVPDQKTFDTIKSAKQTAFNGFITKYKTTDKKKNKRYMLFSKDLNANTTLDHPDALNFINYNSLNQESETDHELQELPTYLSKQVQFSRKRSLSNLIKSLGKEKYMKLKEPCRHSPWMHMNCFSQERKAFEEKQSPEKLKRNVKLIELNLGIRQRNLSGNKRGKN